MRRTAPPHWGRQRLPGNSGGAGPPGARPFAFPPQGFERAANGNLQSVYGEGGFSMATWLWVLIIVLLVLLLFGGVGYGRRGTRV
jgi:hypothetical protein